jgi:prepilin-type N-terminal cleavage/methylation domain-containing protein
MKPASGNRIARHGFTLIELLVVIAIITVILGLLLGAVMRVVGTPDAIQNRDDLSKLHEAVEKFRLQYGVYPPSKILLSNDPAQYATHVLGPSSVAYLQRIWPKMDFLTLQVKNPKDGSVISTVDWSGGTMTGKYAVVLEGDQCLVYFLGGLPATNALGCRGFADSASNPTDLNNDKKLPPLFNFKGERLIRRDPSHTFMSYLDTYTYNKKPFAYFSNNPKTSQYGWDDCQSLGVNPYLAQIKPYKKFVNDDSFQIICAGRDGKFGAPMTPPGTWSKNNPQVNREAEDDESNFHFGKLGQRE